MALVWKERGSGIEHRVLPFRNVLAAEVRQNGTTVTETRTKLGSQLAGAAVGGLVLGGVGAVIGGLSGSKISTSRQQVSYELYIQMNDLEKPLFSMGMLKEHVFTWHALIGALIKQSDLATVAP